MLSKTGNKTKMSAFVLLFNIVTVILVTERREKQHHNSPTQTQSANTGRVLLFFSFLFSLPFSSPLFPTLPVSLFLSFFPFLPSFRSFKKYVRSLADNYTNKTETSVTIFNKDYKFYKIDTENVLNEKTIIRKAIYTSPG